MIAPLFHNAPTFVRHAQVPKAHELVYVITDGVIDVFDATAKDQFPVAQIDPPSGGGNGIWVDSNQDLYVPGGYGVYAFHRGALQPFTFLSVPDVGAVAVCGDDAGHIYVTEGGLDQAPGDTIGVFEAGKHRASSTFYEYNANQLDQCAVDRNGDLFVAYSGGPNGTYAIDEFVAGSQTPQTVISTFLPDSLSSFANIAFDAQGNLVVPMLEGQSPPYQSVVNVYAPPFTGAPVRTLNVEAPTIAFDRTGAYLWTARYDASELSYASGKLHWYTEQISQFGVQDIAVSPPLVP